MIPDSRPAPVRIDDFADPQFTPEVREMLAAIEPLAEQVELRPAALMDLARAETGLDDFGPTDFVERLDVYCAALRNEAGLSQLGYFNMQSQIVKLPRNRLLVEDLVVRHPRCSRSRSPRRSSSAVSPAPAPRTCTT